MHADVDGSLIMPTHTGLMRYNGTDFELLGPADGLPMAGIGWSSQDHKGRIWLHSHSDLLSYYYDGEVHVLDEVNAKLDSFYRYNDFVIDLGDTIWIQYNMERMVLKISPNEDGTGWSKIEEIPYRFRNFRSVKGAGEYVVNYGYTPRKYPDKFEVGFSMKGDTIFRSFPREPRGTRLYLNERIFYGLNYISVQNYLCEYDKGKLLQEKYFDKKILSISEDGLGNLWVSYVDGGVQVFYDADFDKPGKLLLPDYKISYVCRDFEGGYWFSTSSDHELIYIPDLQNQTFTCGVEIPEGTITASYVFRDTLYVGYSDERIWRQTPDGEGELVFQRSEDFILKPMTQLWQFFTIGNDIYATVGPDGLLKFDRATDSFVELMDKRCYYAYSEDSVAYISHFMFGVGKLVNDTLEEVVHFKNNEPRPDFEFLITDDDRLLVSTIAGMWQYKDGKASELTGHPFLEQRVFSFCRLASGELVLGSMGLGVAICSETDTIIIDKSSGLKSNMINYVGQDSRGNLWVSHMMGLSMISGIGSDEGLEVHNLDGNFLLNYTVDQILEFDGKVWAVGADGIWLVRQDQKTATYKIRELEVEANGEFQDSLWKLDYGLNEIEFSFSCIQFNKNVPVEFEYRLLNFNDDWTRNTTGKAKFQKLPPGDYVFQVRVVSPSGASEFASAGIHIITPYWQTWWFIAATALTVVVLISLIVRRRVRSLRRGERNKRKLIESELRTLRAQINPHFTFNAMNSIQNFVSKSDPDTALLYISKFARLMRMILDHTSDDLITIVRELEALELYLELEAMRFGGKFSYEIEVAPNIDIDYHKIPPMTLQPFVENAIWHGIMPKEDQTGTVTVTIVEEGGDIVCSVQDDGIGRPEANARKTREVKARKSYGLKITQERLNLINEEFDQQIEMKIIDLVDAEGKASGTKVEVKLVA